MTMLNCKEIKYRENGGWRRGINNNNAREDKSRGVNSGDKGKNNNRSHSRG
jgi:hypothetical protein